MNLLFRLFYILLFSMRRARVPILGPAQMNLRVLPNDLDILRHMNNGRYFSLMDLGRVDMMVRSGLWPQLKVRGWYPVVTHESMTFSRSLKLFAKYTLTTQVLGWDDKELLIEQIFTSNNKRMAYGLVKARMLKKTGGSVTPQELLEVAQIQMDSPMPAAHVSAFGK